MCWMVLSRNDVAPYCDLGQLSDPYSPESAGPVVGFAWPAAGWLRLTAGSVWFVPSVNRHGHSVFSSPLSWSIDRHSTPPPLIAACLLPSGSGHGVLPLR